MTHEGKKEAPQVSLKQWRLEDFKSVTKASVDFKPLTILVGSNSSGKSTLLQSILLMSQAAATVGAGEAFSLNGTLVSLGAFEDVVCAWKPKYFGIGGTLALPFDPDWPAPTRRASNAHSVDPEGSV